MKSQSVPRVTVVRRDAEKRIDVLVDGQLFTAYMYPDNVMKPVLYPVITRGGHRVTRGFPLDRVAGERVDHPHHVGIWLNYGDVNGLDFWNHSAAIPPERKHKFGTIRHRAVLETREDGATASLAVAADWVRPDGAVLLTERTEFRFAANDEDRIMDRTTTLTAAQGDVLFKDNKEGMVAIRVTRALEQPSSKPEIFTDSSGYPTAIPVRNNEGVSGRYFSSEGLEGDDVWGTRGRWVALAGRLKDEDVAVIMLDHPANPGYPTYWHARGYGLFAANPLGQAAMSNGKEVLNFCLKHNASVKFQYRFVIRSGPRPSNEEIGARYASFGA
jgi:hypothetical protein